MSSSPLSDQPLPTWSQVNNNEEKTTFVRRKKGVEKSYEIGKKIGEGVRRSVYELTSPEGGRKKVLKLDTGVNPKSIHEFEMVKALNKGGSHVGIVKASKYIGDKVVIMPMYKCSLESRVQKQEMKPAETIEALKQIVKGMGYLKERQIYHGDLHLGNVLYGTGKKSERYDISDFEASLDLSLPEKFKNLSSNEKILDAYLTHLEKNLDFPIVGRIEFEELLELPLDKAIDHIQNKFYAKDAKKLGLMVMQIAASYKESSPFLQELNALGSEIYDTETIDGLAEKVNKLTPIPA